ncbi:hypothetical protein [Burkholderia ubonensis]|uniref:hypothetical protein n=1 Tax=Burkholderia ubonensis TaxID=101571 RepID=UPI001055B22C|nr:hypothetical protein [Burkholderia ubonensis]
MLSTNCIFSEGRALLFSRAVFASQRRVHCRTRPSQFELFDKMSWIAENERPSLVAEAPEHPFREMKSPAIVLPLDREIVERLAVIAENRSFSQTLRHRARALQRRAGNGDEHVRRQP